MQDKLKDIIAKYEELNGRLSDPVVINDQNLFRTLAKEHSSIGPVVELGGKYIKANEDMAEAKNLLSESDDKEMQEMAQEEINELKASLEEYEKELKVLLSPKDPNDDKNVILEIRAGTGGEEAALFAADIFRMYNRYAESRNWKVETTNTNFADAGGVKEVTALVNGLGAFSRLKFESGVHRVQRVPATEGSGRVHTSAITVAVLPEVEDVAIDIAENELRIDRFCSSGPGGQSVNTTQSAIRITHIPTGLVVSCQDEKSQHKNKAKALKVLKSRLYDLKLREQQDAIASERKGQVGSGDRSEKIRTYNFPQNRVTDHRIGMTLHKLGQVMEGALDEVIDALVTHYQAEQLAEEVESMGK
jgi:peptide chain release factor 1